MRFFKGKRLRFTVFIAVAVIVIGGAVASVLMAEPREGELEPIRILGTVAFSGAAGNIGPAYDRAMKLAVKEIVFKNGAYATFMPKPFADENGSGMHINMSLFGDGRNAFFDICQKASRVN